MSRLDEIRVRLEMPAEIVVQLDDRQRQIIDDAKHLLAVVDAVLGKRTPEKKAYWARQYADNGRFWYDQKTAKHYDAVAAAWDALS